MNHEAENERLREALEWIRHQCGVATVDDAVFVMNEVYDAADRVLRRKHAAAPCRTCGGRGWHTAGGNDPMACSCPAGETWNAS